jgi:hypothetical protein
VVSGTGVGVPVGVPGLGRSSSVCSEVGPSSLESVIKPAIAI